jgi:hypothetical protein
VPGDVAVLDRILPDPDAGQPRLVEGGVIGPAESAALRRRDADKAEVGEAARAPSRRMSAPSCGPKTLIPRARTRTRVDIEVTAKFRKLRTPGSPPTRSAGCT